MTPKEKKITIIVAIILLLVIVFGIWWWYKKKNSANGVSPVAVANPTPSANTGIVPPLPGNVSPAQQIDKSQVLKQISTLQTQLAAEKYKLYNMGKAGFSTSDPSYIAEQIRVDSLTNQIAALQKSINGPYITSI